MLEGVINARRDAIAGIPLTLRCTSRFHPWLSYDIKAIQLLQNRIPNFSRSSSSLSHVAIQESRGESLLRQQPESAVLDMKRNICELTGDGVESATSVLAGKPTISEVVNEGAISNSTLTTALPDAICGGDRSDLSPPKQTSDRRDLSPTKQTSDCRDLSPPKQTSLIAKLPLSEDSKFAKDVDEAKDVSERSNDMSPQEAIDRAGPSCQIVAQPCVKDENSKSDGARSAGRRSIKDDLAFFDSDDDVLIDDLEDVDNDIQPLNGGATSTEDNPNLNNNQRLLDILDFVSKDTQY